MGLHSARMRTGLAESTFCCLACSAAFLYWLFSLHRPVRPAGVGYLLALPVLLMLSGQVVIRVLRMRPLARYTFPLEVTLGFSVVTPAVFVLDAFTPCPTVACWSAAGVAVIMAYALQRSRGPAAPTAEGEPHGLLPAWWGSLVVALILAAAALWTQELRPYASRSEQVVVVRPWADVFVHAQISGLMAMDRSMPQLGNPDLVGTPLPVYHYGSYVYPAAVEGWAGVPAMDAVMAFWIPFGVVLMGLASYALAAEWWSDAVGLAALTAVLLVPDASKYGVPVQWYSFHWLLAVSPGLTYGITTGAAALALAINARRSRQSQLLWAGLALAASTLALKAQVFLSVVPLLVVWAIWYANDWPSRRRWRVTAGLAATVVAGLLIEERLGIGPDLMPSLRHPVNRSYWTWVSSTIGIGWWHHMLVAPNPSLARQGGVALVELIVAPLGLVAAIVPTMLAVKTIRRTLRPTDSIPVIAFALHLLLSTLPRRNTRGGPDEVWHRPFVWMVFILLVWCAGQLMPLLGGRRGRFILAAAAAGLLVVPWQFGRTVQRSLLTMPQLVDMPLPSGLVDSAEYLRTHSAITAVIQRVTPAGDVPELRDEPLLSSLAERRCYLGRSPTFWSTYYASSAAAAEAEWRGTVIERLKVAGTAESFRDIAKRIGIDWVVFDRKDRPAWLDDMPAFESHGYTVYRVGTSPPRP